jgi:prepilin-type N-terminal cleavage/methylation domain-containing protein
MYQRIRQRGFTMVELMISMVLGLLLTGALVTMLAEARQSFREDGEFASMQDEARYAVRELSNDLRMAGFVTSLLMPDNISLDPGADVGVDCADSGGTSWALTLQDPLTGEDTFLMALDNVTGAAAVDEFSCLTASQIVPGTDIVAIKRAAGNPTTAVSTGDMAIRSNGTVGSMFVEPITTPVTGTVEDWLFTPTIYFIRNFSNTAGDGIPSLCRMIMESGTPPNMVTECIAEGVEDLQLEYGVDSNGDGSINAYITDPTQAELERTISVRFFLLSRTANLDVNTVDTKTYQLSNADDYTPNDNFHRRVFSSTVSVPNARNRLVLGL